MAGLLSAGVDVLLLGVLPTPGVAYLTESLRADLGVVLSASHNPMPDNGIKFLARGGVKLDDTIEMAIEKRLREPWDRPTGAAVGRVSTYDAAVERLRRPPRLHRRAPRWPASRWSSTAPTAPPPRPVRGCCATPAPRWWRSAPSRTA